jgi:hypothetical protein
MLGVAACSSDDDTSTSTTSDGGASEGQVDEEYETWCTSVQNVIDQNGAEGLSLGGQLASVSQTLQSLAQNAPEPIEEQMQLLATTSQALLAANDQSADVTVPQENLAEAEQAAAEVRTWISDNCGIDVPDFNVPTAGS